MTESDPFPGYLAMAPTLGAAAIIWANGGLVACGLSFRPFVWVGRLSYALYLWHWPLISIAAGIGLPPTSTGTRIAITAIMLALSVIGYYLWEQPIRQRRLFQGRKAFFTALAVFVLVLVGVGLTIFQTKGIPQRLPADLVAMEQAAKADSFYIVKRCPSLMTGGMVPCGLGDEEANAVSFAIIGDSHAQAVAAEIGELAKPYHLRGVYLGRAGCPPLAGLTRTANSSCAAQYEFAMNEIRKLQPELVILISQWTGVTGDPEGGYKTPLFSKSGPIAESDRLSIVSAALDKTLADIGNRKVVTALTVPEYNGKASIVWQRWTERLGFPKFTTETSVKDYWERQTYVKNMLDQAKRKYKNLEVLDPTPILCDATKCIRATGNDFLYRDNSHLSHVGAELYATQFEPYFSALADRK